MPGAACSTPFIFLQILFDWRKLKFDKLHGNVSAVSGFWQRLLLLWFHGRMRVYLMGSVRPLNLNERFVSLSGSAMLSICSG